MFVLKKLLKLNVFADSRTQAQANSPGVHDQILSARMYIILFNKILFVIALFTILRPRSIVGVVAKPSLDTYLQLESTHPSTLSYLCRQPSVLYANFFSLEPIGDQVKACEYSVLFCRFHRVVSRVQYHFKIASHTLCFA